MALYTHCISPLPQKLQAWITTSRSNLGLTTIYSILLTYIIASRCPFSEIMHSVGYVYVVFSSTNQLWSGGGKLCGSTWDE